MAKLELPTDLELVLAAAATYNPDSKPFVSDLGSAIRVFLTKRGDGLNIIAIEGTHNPIGWAVDFFGLTVQDQQSMQEANLGFLHAGFYGAAISILTRVALVAARGPYAICGHSLGGVLALLVGALLIDDYLPPIKIGAFAPPRAGGDKFVKIATSVPFCAYRFGNDPVPEIPVRLPDFPYAQVPLVAIGKPMFNPFDCHHIDNYVEGVRSNAR